ncbi:hypothetical protein ES332_A07G168500v1 [Gossypium tomentosum]|uniref:D-isomer specific 2-hydroxyacid dehydrogenase NAD-binding domain-containing protein n=1 Tax=Gossypium tomentosum TaxID=34277 RepID=A0A5D2PTL1_GOSTO|nr:hypothetical protein ES332_A07G168500v1 [Gossypium tomentosum]
MAVAAENQSQPPQNDLPYVLILKPPTAFSIFGDHFFHSPKFQFLKPFESPLPLPQFLLTHAQSVQAILTSASGSVTADTIRLLPRLGLVVTTSQGINHIDLSECRRRGIAVAGAGTIFSTDCADSAVGLLLDVLRKVSAANRYVKQGLWSTQGNYPLGYKLGGKQVGIVGLGSIRCSISYNSRSKKPSVPYTFYPNVVELAVNCDALIICCALTDETHHLIGKEVLSALGKDGVIINIARGPIIDEKELVQCLIKREIRGAGLDVFEHEPDVPVELLALDNVVMSPHKAVCTTESLEELRKTVTSTLTYFATKVHSQSRPLRLHIIDMVVKTHRLTYNRGQPQRLPFIREQPQRLPHFDVTGHILQGEVRCSMLQGEKEMMTKSWCVAIIR